MSGALSGIRVIDWSWWHQGPATGSILGDLGAEVIKIEDPIRGDPYRGLTRYMGLDVLLPGNRIPHIELANRNKRGITLDLKKKKGQEILYRLIGNSDVFINNFRREVRNRLNVDYETLSRHNPRLIYATASGFGRDGPDADLHAFDTIGTARSGLMYNIGEPNMPPQQMAIGIGDQIGATVLVYGILAAIINRDKTGEGQEVEASLYGSLIHTQAMAIQTFLMTGKMPPRPERTAQFNPLVSWYQCQDGKWVVFAHNTPQEYWHKFCQALGITEVENDPKFTTTRARGENHKELIALLDRVIATKPQAEWLKRFREWNLFFGPINTIEDLPNDPQVTENNYIVGYDHPTLGRTKVVGFPVQFSKTPSEISLPAPELGEHTEQVLMDLCGYSWDEIGEFREEGVI